MALGRQIEILNSLTTWLSMAKRRKNGNAYCATTHEIDTNGTRFLDILPPRMDTPHAYLMKDGEYCSMTNIMTKYPQNPINLKNTRIADMKNGRIKINTENGKTRGGADTAKGNLTLGMRTESANTYENAQRGKNSKSSMPILSSLLQEYCKRKTTYP